MRRSELVTAVDTVSNAIEGSHIVEFLRMIAEHIRPEGKEAEGPDEFFRRGPMGMEVMHVFQRYSVAAHAFGPVEGKVAALFGLERLADPDFWSRLVVRPGRDPDFNRYIEQIAGAAKNLAAPQQLLTPARIEVPSAPTGQTAAKMERLSILIVEEKGRLSRPARLVNVLQGVASLYDTHAFLLSVPVDTLLVAACDSGSDKAFDFLGVAEAIQAIKETILSLWDRVVFFRERKLLVNVRLVAEALPVLAEISALAERKAIGPEQAEILRRQVIDGASQLIEAGGITLDLVATSHRDVRALAAPEPKLLGPAALTGPAAQGSDPPKPKRKGRKTKRRDA